MQHNLDDVGGARELARHRTNYLKKYPCKQLSAACRGFLYFLYSSRSRSTTVCRSDIRLVRMGMPTPSRANRGITSRKGVRSSR